VATEIALDEPENKVPELPPDLEGADVIEDDFGDEETSDTETVELRIRPVNAGRRLDSFLAARFPDRSRAWFQKLIKGGRVLVNGQPTKPSREIAGGEIVHVELPPPTKMEIEPENIPLDIVYEDDLMVVINKPAGMIVHPARGNWGGTLVNALAFHFQKLSGVNGPERPGIVHRLDRDTTGVILVAKDDRAHAQMARQWENRRVKKEYLAIVEGTPNCDADVIDKPIGHHPKVREKMAIDLISGREAVTRYQVDRRYRGYALVTCKPLTGRTHQIRIHLASVGLKVLADAAYSSRSQLTLADLTGKPEDAAQLLITRQALHARRLTIWHPMTGKQITFEAPIPEDMRRTIAALEQHRAL
jgi:23S rRNA pseudouridine1911/1915/1917 synthase